MDPVSVCATVSGLVVAIEQIVVAIYQYGKGVKDSKKEITQMCSELYALKGALEHIRINLQNTAASSTASSITTSPIMGTDDFISMLETTRSVLSELSKPFVKERGRVGAVFYRLAWPLKVEDIKSEAQRIERLKSYFILATTTDNLEISKQMYLEIRSIARKLDSQQEQQDTAAQASFRKSVMKWLAPFDPSQLYRAALASEQASTGRWFLDGPLQDWLSGASPPILWLRGKPGIGKTTLVSAAINEMETHMPGGANAVAYYFCSFTNLASQDPVNLVGSLLVQLCNLNPILWTDIDAPYSKEIAKISVDPARLSLGEVGSMLENALRVLLKTYIVVDAFNESKQSTLMLSTLCDLTRGNEGLRLMFSSTEELFVPSERLSSLSLSIVSITAALVHDDVRAYVDFCLIYNDRLCRLPSTLKDDIRAKLLSWADGSFRWVQCQIESVVLQKTPLAIKAALEAVPSTLEQSYRNILDRIPSGDRDLARRAFLWMAFSIRALKFEELCEAVIIDEEHGTIDESARLLRPEDLLQLCSSLISYEPEERTMVLAHSSVLEYLTSEQIKKSDVQEFYLDPTLAHTALTRKCVSYLSSPRLRNGYCKEPEESRRRRHDLPLLSYAVRSWPLHGRYLDKTGIDESTHNFLLHFFETFRLPRGGNFGAWVREYFPSARVDVKGSTPLYYASRFGINSIVKMILAVQGTKDLEVRGGRSGSTPLHVASWAGGLEVVRTLIAAGANVREVNNDGSCGLEWAAFYGRLGILKLLLAAGADPNFRGPFGHTPLYHALHNEDEACSMVIIEAGANTDDIDGEESGYFTLRKRLEAGENANDIGVSDFSH